MLDGRSQPTFRLSGLSV
jgi:hypothetical protein